MIETEENQDPEDEAAGEEVESSLDELLAKKEQAEAATDDTAPEGEAVEPVVPAPAAREERVETLTTKVVPEQPTEFTCRNCFLVKHRSQLKNKKRMLCRDCA